MRVMSEEKLNKLAEFIKQYARDNNGESPSLADIMDYMGMVKSTAYRHVLELEKRGVISYTGKKTLSSPLQRKMSVMSRRIPIVGMIVCGTPDEQEEHITGYLAVQHRYPQSYPPTSRIKKAHAAEDIRSAKALQSSVGLGSHEG